MCYALPEALFILEFLLFLIGGIAYGFYFDLNPLETVLVGIVLLCAFRGWLPQFPITKAWRLWNRFARRQGRAVAAVFILALVVRCALLPVLPVPKPAITDEFSHLLLADTLAHGRLTNPTHPMWVCFESIHIIQKPTYNSDYFPGQGAMLALGELAGHPWVASLLLCAAMCAACCWALQAWLPPAWALFAGVLAILRFGIASYWINGYYGGCLGALGGALAVGAYPRLLRKPSLGLSLALGLGIAMIGYARPLEGLAVAVPIVALTAAAVFRGRVRFRFAIPSAAIVIGAVGFLLVYNKAVTGDALKPPYAVNQATYGWPMTLPWFHPSTPVFRHEELRRYYEYEKLVHDRNASLFGTLKFSTTKLEEIWRFYFGPAFSVALVMLSAVWRSGRSRLLLIMGGLTVLVSLVETGTSPHYAACATACFLGIEMECLRRLSRYRHQGRNIGISIVFAIPAIITLILIVRLGLGAAHLPYTQRVNYLSWCCVKSSREDKAQIQAMLEKMPGQHLVLVKPKSDPDNLFQWIYNAADIDGAKVVWARDMGDNDALLRYFQGREVWELDPNVEPARLSPR